MEIEIAMTLDQAIEACRQVLRAGFSVEVRPHPHRDGTYLVETMGCDVAPTVVERGCPMGCGRILRSHERHCPSCVQSMGGPSQYEQGGGC